jgi:hypothetical protein
MLQNFVILNPLLYHTFAIAVWDTGLIIVDTNLSSSVVRVCVCVCVCVWTQCCKVVTVPIFNVQNYFKQ